MILDIADQIPLEKWPKFLVLALSDGQLSFMTASNTSFAQAVRLQHLQAYTSETVAALSAIQIAELMTQVPIKHWPVRLIFALKPEQMPRYLGKVAQDHIERVQRLRVCILAEKFGPIDAKSTMLEIDQATYDPRRDGPKRPS